MKVLGKLAVLGALLTASASCAFANTISGSVWELPNFYNVPTGGPGGGGNTGVYVTTATATFTVSNPSSNIFNFISGGSIPNPTNYSLTGFLTSGGDTLSYLTGSSHGGDLLNTPQGCTGSGMSSNCLVDDLFQFTGTTSLANGGVYTFTSDDGIILYINGVAVLSNAAPTAADTITLCVGSATGCDYSMAMPTGPIQTFTLDYAEVDGPPGELETNLPAALPEPSSLMLVGTGLFGVAGVMFRRRGVKA